MVDIADLAGMCDWDHALSLARDGDLSELVRGLRESSSNPTIEVRKFLAELVERKLVRGAGAPRKVTYRKIVEVRSVVRYVKRGRRDLDDRAAVEALALELGISPEKTKAALKRAYPPLGKLNVGLANRLGVSKQTIRDIAAGRGRFKKILAFF